MVVILILLILQMIVKILIQIPNLQLIQNMLMKPLKWPYLQIIQRILNKIYK